MPELASTPQEALPLPRKFGTFEGVFTPTLLTILGVIMYLREGWVVGNAGFLGAVAIILGAFAITGATGLSLSSLTTDIHIGAGGAYSIIPSRSLEVGGAVGIPLYISQALAVAMYVFGFRAGVQYIAPLRLRFSSTLAALAFLLVVANVGPSLAFRVQFFILAAIAASLVSIGVAAATRSMKEPVTIFGELPGARLECAVRHGPRGDLPRCRAHGDHELCPREPSWVAALLRASTRRARRAPGRSAVARKAGIALGARDGPS